VRFDNSHFSRPCRSATSSPKITSALRRASIFIAQGYVDQIGHGLGRPASCRRAVSGSDQCRCVESCRRGIEIRRIYVLHHALLGRGRQGCEAPGPPQFASSSSTFFSSFVDAFFVEDAPSRKQKLWVRETGSRAAFPLAARHRDDTKRSSSESEWEYGRITWRVNKRRPVALAAIFAPRAEKPVTGHRIGAVGLPRMKIRKARNQPRYATSPPSALPPARRSRSRYPVRQKLRAVWSAQRRSSLPRTRLRWWCRRPGNVGNLVAAEAGHP